VKHCGIDPPTLEFYLDIHIIRYVKLPLNIFKDTRGNRAVLCKYLEEMFNVAVRSREGR
jgi:hypothetical protein